MHAIDITNVTPLLLSLPLGGAFVYALIQIVKKAAKMDNEHAIHALAVLVSVATAAVTYALQFKGLPADVLGFSVPSVYGFSQGLYKLCKLLAMLLPRVSVTLSNLLSNLKSNKTDASLSSVDAAATEAAAAFTAPAPTEVATEPAEPANNGLAF